MPAGSPMLGNGQPLLDFNWNSDFPAGESDVKLGRAMSPSELR